MLLRCRQQFPATFFDSGSKEDLFPALGSVIFLYVPFFSRYSYPKARSGISGFLAEISDVSSCRTLWSHQCHRYPNRFQCIRQFLLLIRSLIFFNLWPFSIKLLSFVLLFFASFIIYLFPRWNLIVQVKGVLRRTVSSDWLLNILSRSHPQGQVTAGNSNECSDALVSNVIGCWNSNVIGSEDGEECLMDFDSVCKWSSQWVVGWE